MVFMLFILGKPNIAPDPASGLGYSCSAQGVRAVQDTHDCLAGRAKPRGLGELVCAFLPALWTEQELHIPGSGHGRL